MPAVPQFLDHVRARVVASATSPFGHADFPLRHTMRYRGDAGLFGPDAVSWRVIGDASAFVGGIRALFVQGAHPEVVAGVADHSTYRQDPLGRLSRTSSYVTATTFGAMPEVARAVEAVRTAHRPVKGLSHRGRRYSAGRPQLAAWVHNALTDSFLHAYRAYGPDPLTVAEADRFVEEQAEIGRLLDADPLPRTAGDLRAWIAGHPELAPSPGMEEVVRFLKSPPLDRAQWMGYRLLMRAAIDTIPRRLRGILGVRTVPGAARSGRAVVAGLRWALGSSPSWNLALLRIGADVPPGLFRQRIPPEALEPSDPLGSSEVL